MEELKAIVFPEFHKDVQNEFDVVLSPTVQVNEINVKKERIDDDEEMFFAPLSLPEKCVPTSPGLSEEHRIKTFSPVTKDQYVEIFQEATKLALRFEKLSSSTSCTFSHQDNSLSSSILELSSTESNSPTWLTGKASNGSSGNLCVFQFKDDATPSAMIIHANSETQSPTSHDGQLSETTDDKFPILPLTGKENLEPGFFDVKSIEFVENLFHKYDADDLPHVLKDRRNLTPKSSIKNLTGSLQNCEKHANVIKNSGILRCDNPSDCPNILRKSRKVGGKCDKSKDMNTAIGINVEFERKDGICTSESISKDKLLIGENEGSIELRRKTAAENDVENAIVNNSEVGKVSVEKPVEDTDIMKAVNVAVKAAGEAKNASHDHANEEKDVKNHFKIPIAAAPKPVASLKYGMKNAKMFKKTESNLKHTEVTRYGNSPVVEKKSKILYSTAQKQPRRTKGKSDDANRSLDSKLQRIGLGKIDKLRDGEANEETAKTFGKRNIFSPQESLTTLRAERSRKTQKLKLVTSKLSKIPGPICRLRRSSSLSSLDSYQSSSSSQNLQDDCTSTNMGPMTKMLSSKVCLASSSGLTRRSKLHDPTTDNKKATFTKGGIPKPGIKSKMNKMSDTQLSVNPGKIKGETYGKVDNSTITMTVTPRSLQPVTSRGSSFKSSFCSTSSREDSNLKYVTPQMTDLKSSERTVTRTASTRKRRSINISTTSLKGPTSLPRRSSKNSNDDSKLFLSSSGVNQAKYSRTSKRQLISDGKLSTGDYQSRTLSVDDLLECNDFGFADVVPMQPLQKES